MTNQEIYNKLGDIGTLTFIGVEMARIDGEVDQKEYAAIANAFVRFASEDRQNKESFDNMIKDVMEVIQGFESFEDKKSYVETALLHMTKKYDKDLRNAMLEEISKIAHADDELHDNEAGLLNLCKQYFD
jgi:uncharacterized tellurite resistance protein B-like protein